MSKLLDYPSREQCLRGTGGSNVDIGEEYAHTPDATPAKIPPAVVNYDQLAAVFAFTSGAIYDNDPTTQRYYAIGTVSDRGAINEVHVQGLKNACEAYSLLLRDPKYNKYQKIRRPGRFPRIPGWRVDWCSSIGLDETEIWEFAEIEENCKGAAEADFDAHRERLSL